MFKTSHLQEMKRRYEKMYASPEEGTDELVDQYKEDTPGQGKEIEEHCGVCGEQGIEEDSDKDKPGTQGDQAEYQRKRKEIAKKFGVDACAQLKDEDKKKACFAALDAAHVSDDEEKEKKEEVELDEKDPSKKIWPPTVETLRAIVDGKSAGTVKFKDGKALVDTFSASALIQVYDALKRPELKKTFEKMIQTTDGYKKSMAFAFKMTK